MQNLSSDEEQATSKIRQNLTSTNLKPSGVLDQIKIKVKQKRTPNYKTEKQRSKSVNYTRSRRRGAADRGNLNLPKILVNNRANRSSDDESNHQSIDNETIVNGRKNIEEDTTRAPINQPKALISYSLSDAKKRQVKISEPDERLNNITKIDDMPENSIKSFPESRLHSQSMSTISHGLMNTSITTMPSLPTNLNTQVALTNTSNYSLTCHCENHPCRLYVDQLVSLNVDTLFDLTFGENGFTRAYHESQKLIDYKIGDWNNNTETGKRERTVTYKTVTQSILGNNTIFCTEKQTIELEKSGFLCVVSSEVYNEGMKYTDAFYVATRFCMIQRDKLQSLFRISAEVRYVKNVNGIAKAFIDKNAYASIESGIQNLIQRIENYQRNYTESSKKKTTAEKKLKRTAIVEKRTENRTELDTITTVPNENQRRFFLDIILLIGVLLLILHIYLCVKLYSIDRILYNPQFSCLEQCQKACLINLTNR